MTTNLSLDEIEGRIRSRLADRELVTDVRINTPDYRRPLDDTGHSEPSSLDLMTSKTFGSFEDRVSEGLQTDELKVAAEGDQAAHRSPSRTGSGLSPAPTTTRSCTAAPCRATGRPRRPSLPQRG